MVHRWKALRVGDERLSHQPVYALVLPDMMCVFDPDPQIVLRRRPWFEDTVGAFVHDLAFGADHVIGEAPHWSPFFC